jgi:hypothetical protein
MWQIHLFYDTTNHFTYPILYVFLEAVSCMPDFRISNTIVAIKRGTNSAQIYYRNDQKMMNPCV